MLLPFVAFATMNTSCKMAPNDDPGDTVAAKVFAPIDTAALHRKQAAKKLAGKDSTDIFFVGEGSDSRRIQLISYPSRRDTLSLPRTRHMKRQGNTAANQAVRVTFYVQGKDSMVARIQALDSK